MFVAYLVLLGVVAVGGLQGRVDGGEKIVEIEADAVVDGLTLASGVTLRGAATLRLKSPIEINGASHVRIEGLRLILDGASSAVRVRDSSDITIEAVSIDGRESGFNGIEFHDSQRVAVLSTTILNAGRETTGGSGVVLQRCEAGRVVACTIDNSARCAVVMYQDNRMITIERNHISRWMQRRERLGDGGVDCYGPGNSMIRVIGNMLDTGDEQPAAGATSTAVRFSGVEGGRIESNQVLMRSPRQHYAFEVTQRREYRSRDIGLESNVFEAGDSLVAFVRLINANGVQITANQARGKQRAATFITANAIQSDEIRVRGNMVSGCAYLFSANAAIGSLAIVDNQAADMSSIVMVTNKAVEELRVERNAYATSYRNCVYVYPSIRRLHLSANAWDCSGEPVANRDNGQTEVIEN